MATAAANDYKEKTNEKLLAIHVKRVMNATLYQGFQQWHGAIRSMRASNAATREAEMLALAEDRLNEMNKQQTQAKLKVFWNRMRTMKEMAAWRQWMKVVDKGRNKAVNEQIADAVAESRKKMATKMENEIKLKLKMFKASRAPQRTTFDALLNEARLQRNKKMEEHAKKRLVSGFVKQRLVALKLNTLIALKANKAESKTIRLRETDAIKKLRQMMTAKLKGVLFATFGALQKEFFEIRAEKMAADSDIQGQQIHMRALESMADLFLLAKEDRKVSAAWHKWCREVAKTKVNALYAKTKREERAKCQAEQSMLQMTKKMQKEKSVALQLETERNGGVERQSHLEMQLHDQEDEIQDLQLQNAKLQSKVREVKEEAQEAIDQREQANAEIARLRAKCAALEAELDTIVDEIGFVKEAGAA